MRTQFDLSKKNILFTAAASYLGRAMSEALAECGANMILTSRNPQTANDLADSYASKYEGKFVGISFDISKTEEISNVIKAAEERLGPIDVLVNNAYYGIPDLLHEVTPERWAYGIDGSINTVFRTTHEVLLRMIERKSGNIINIASMYGMVPPDYHVYEDIDISCNPPSYGVGKAAVIQFTKYIAAYYGKDGIRANAISPGPFPSIEVQKNKKFIQNLSKKTPLGRIGSPDDLAGIIVLLASDSSAYITGQNIAVDGGWTTW